ncbi:hypothetical protein [Carnobacterium maltaromaticum]|uniref:hypothetical protein n=1 Tax=Carnobacterium maltaromaticum TaxID=2751 RepID=UPI00191BAF18|nr:hypothetical protein [Carnobacterium maltaromaticum]CAD5903105.1 conserved hypothetical protein [Carnobacterium maltaromaticum]
MRIEDHWIDCSVYRIGFKVKGNTYRRIDKTIIVDARYCDSDVEKLIGSKFKNAETIELIEFIDDALLTKECELLNEYS